MGRPLQLKNGVWRVQEGEDFVRLLVPKRMRVLAPCAKDTNWKCNKCVSVHLRPDDDSNMALPTVQWLRVRISDEEWTDFVAALDAANLQGTVPCYPCLIVPCTFPGMLCMPLCDCLPYQYAASKEVQAENALNLVVARYNRHLFMPRQIVVRRQREALVDESGENGLFNFLRLDFARHAPPPLDHDGLVDGLRPGTQKSDLPHLSRDEYLQNYNVIPCGMFCARWRQFVAAPRYFFEGDEPELDADANLVARYAEGNAEFRAAVMPDDMLRA